MRPDSPAPNSAADARADQPAHAAGRDRLLAESEAARAVADLERRRLATVLEQLPVGVVVAEAPSGRIVQLNEAVREIWGVAAATTNAAAYSTDYVARRPGGTAPYQSHEWPLARALATGEIVAGEVVEVERPDGTRRFVSLSAAPVRDADGTILGAVVTSHDVTEREVALAALAASERQARTIAENATLALFIMDEQQRCTYMNPAAERLTGFTLAELHGRALHYHIHHTRPDGTPYPLEECPIDQAFPQNMREQGTEVFVHKDGHFYPVAFTASPLREGDRTVGTIIEVRDIADDLAAAAERERLLAAERAARAEAESANQAKSEFLATMSHELRTPLNAVQGHLQLVQLGVHGPVTPRQHEALTRIDRAQRHLQGLIGDILDYARIEGGHAAYDVRPLLVADVVRDVAPMVEPLLAANGLAFEVRLPEDAGAPPIPVLADREKLAQILLNLLSNAGKFTPRGGRVWLELAEPGAADPGAAEFGAELVAVRVTDTGVGIPADKLEAVFEPFVQVRGAYEPGQGGTGLGLAISRDLARGMGGDLRVRSAEGEGSEFSILLRRAAGRPGSHD